MKLTKKHVGMMATIQTYDGSTIDWIITGIDRDDFGQLARVNLGCEAFVRATSIVRVWHDREGRT